MIGRAAGAIISATKAHRDGASSQSRHGQVVADTLEGY